MWQAAQAFRFEDLGADREVYEVCSRIFSLLHPLVRLFFFLSLFIAKFVAKVGSVLLHLSVRFFSWSFFLVRTVAKLDKGSPLSAVLSTFPCEVRGVSGTGKESG